MHGDPLAQLVERGHQLQRPVAEPQPGQPRLRAVQLVAGVRKYGQASQARFVLQLLQERERRRVGHAEIEDHAPVRERPQRVNGLVRADGRLHPDRSVQVGQVRDGTVGEQRQQAASRVLQHEQATRRDTAGRGGTATAWGLLSLTGLGGLMVLGGLPG